MKKQKPQFDSLFSLNERFPDDKSCREFLEKARWSEKPICPHCKHDKVYRFSDGKLFKCAKCRKQFTVTVGTIFEDSHISLKKWFFAIYLITAHKKGISSLQLSKDLKVTQKTAWFILHRVRYAVKTKEFKAPLGNIVEADETYIGGKKHKGKRGRGSENKTAVFGMVERQGELFSIPVENTKKATIQPIINSNVSSTATIMTDEWKAYIGLNKLFSGHNVVNHGQKEYVNGITHVNTIEGYWSLLKRGLIGIYHHVSPKHLHRYCNEFDYRYNTKELTDPQRFSKTLSICKGRLEYKSLIKK